MSVLRIKREDVPARRKERGRKMESVSTKQSGKRRREPPTSLIMTSNRAPGYTYK